MICQPDPPPDHLQAENVLTPAVIQTMYRQRKALQLLTLGDKSFQVNAPTPEKKKFADFREQFTKYAFGPRSSNPLDFISMYFWFPKYCIFILVYFKQCTVIWWTMFAIFFYSAWAYPPPPNLKPFEFLYFFYRFWNKNDCIYAFLTVY